MASYTTKVTWKAKPPERGSFPIDHEGECKQFQRAFMKCLRDNKGESDKCRQKSMEYLECRMNNNLMERESWVKLGYDDLQKEKT